MTTPLLPTPQPTDRPRPLDAPLAADCAADPSGGLTFTLPDLGAAPAHLLLRRRGRSGRPEEVRLPFERAADGRLRATLPERLALAEGRWDAFVQTSALPPSRLLPGILDLRQLVGRVPDLSLDEVTARIPYATKHGNLSVRTWRRAPHAEATELLLTEGRLSVHGRLHGAQLSARATAQLSGRHPDKPLLPAELGGNAREFTLTVDHADLAGTPGVWDLWLLPDGEPGPRVRVARLLDDIADRGPVFVYPAARVGEVTVTPYYTADNDLSVRVAAG